MPENILYSVDKPYPEIADATKNAETVAILKNLYASRASELTAISDYIYQSIILESQNEDIAKLLEHIAIVEMKHLDMLGSAIVKFGGDPTFTNSRNVNWSACWQFKNKNIITLLKHDIHDETYAISAYSTAAANVDNQSLTDLLLRIAEDEQLHRKLLTDALQSISSPMQ